MSSQGPPDELAARLGAYLARRLARPVEVLGLAPLAGGASRETWAFDLRADGGDAQRLVLRRDPPGKPAARDCEHELRLLAAARAAGVPVPEPRWAESSGEALGSPFIVMERVEGETIPRRVLRAAAAERLLPQCGAALARIHAMPPAGLDFLGPPLAPLELLERQRGVLDGWVEPHPFFDLALCWLGERPPAPAGRPAVVHGDFRVGNLVVGGDGLRAVLDWELAHVGDPAEDLGWFCVRAWRFGVDARPAGGLGSREALVAAYAAAGGDPPDPAALRFWETYGALRWGVICLVQASYHLTGAARSVELAAIGRRACEMEWDLLELMEGKPLPPGGGDGPPGPEGGLATTQDRPTAPELLEAIAEFLAALDLAPSHRFHARVATNLLHVLEREWLLAPAHAERQRALLAHLLGPDATPAALAAAIRRGDLDGRRPAVVAALGEITRQKLAVANPGYERPGA